MAKKDINIPGDRLYTDEHVWIKKEDGAWVCGISDYAQDQLGEVAYVDLPAADRHLEAHDEFGSIESVKAVNSLYMPVAGKITEVNTALEDSPESVNADCYGQGWLIRIEPDNPDDIQNLMGADAYDKFLKQAK